MAAVRIRIGVAGLGAVAQAVHLPLIHRRWDLFELVAVADLSRQLLDSVGDQYGVTPEHRYLDVEQMIREEQLDGVLLLTTGSHGSLALAAITAGVAVFCEKPLAFSLAETDALARAEQAAGRPMLLLAYMKEYDPAVTTARGRLPHPDTIRYVEVEVLHPSGQSQLAFANLRPPAGDVDPDTIAGLRAADDAILVSVLGSEAPPALRSAYANLVLGSLIHDIAVLRSLVGSVTSVDRAIMWREDVAPGSIEIGGTISARARLHMHWHYLPDYPAYTETVRIHHETGTIEIRFTVPYLVNAPTSLRIVESDGPAETVTSASDVTAAFELELAAFAAMVTDRTPPPTGIAQGREDVITGQRIAIALAATQGVVLAGEAAGHLSTSVISNE